MKNKTDATVSTKPVKSRVSDTTVSKYSEISNDVWTFFKSYLPEGADLSDVVNDIEVLDKKYKDSDKYRFMRNLLKVYFDELREVKG